VFSHAFAIATKTEVMSVLQMIFSPTS